MHMLRLSVLLWVVSASVAHAAIDLDRPGHLTTGFTEKLIETAAIATSHRAYMPATPLPTFIGIDVGIEGTLTPLPRDFRNAAAEVSSDAKIPPFFPLPRINAHKGLPFGTEAGISYIRFSEFRALGLDLKWAALGAPDRERGFENLFPSLAFRGSYTNTRMWFINTTHWALDAVLSIPLLIVEPYAAVGYEFGTGELLVPNLNLLPPGVQTHHNFGVGRVYLGLPFDFLLLKTTFEGGYSFAGIYHFGVKVALGF